MEYFNILYSIDNRYIDILLASIYSLISNGGIKNLKIHIITSNFEKNDYKKIELFLNQFNIEHYFYPLEEFNIRKHNIPDWKNSQIANSRLFFQEILKDSIDDISNLLYLDSDTVVVDDLSGIKEYQDGIFAVTDCGILKGERKDFGNLAQYYNSGVLYINVSDWLNNDYQTKIIHNIEQSNLKLSLPDQDLLNIALSDKIKPLPLRYNIPPAAYIFNNFFAKGYFNKKLKYIGFDEVKDEKENPIILHSYGLSNIKPWDSSINPFHEEFMKYLLQINPDFKSDELNKLQRMVIKAPKLFYATLLLRCYLPDDIEKNIKKFAKRLKK